MPTERRARRLLPVVLACLAAGGCSNRTKKLGAGGNLMSQVYYDVLGGERAPSYYYSVVRDSHDAESFCYRCGDDPYLVDKNVDALQKLGGVRYGRLEGQGNTITLMLEVLLEDRSALARSAAAVSLTRLGTGLPRYVQRGAPDDGSRLATAMGELKSWYGATNRLAPGGAARVAQLLTEIGDAAYDPGVYAKKALQFLGTMPGLIDERDPSVRAAQDTALVKTARQAIVYGLTAAVEGPTDYVRADAIRGLKALGDPSAVEAVNARVAVEVSPRVRGEATEYLARIGSGPAVAGLVHMLGDVDGSVRWKARQGLVRSAGQDLGPRQKPWERWALTRWPDLELGRAPEGGPADPGG